MCHLGLRFSLDGFVMFFLRAFIFLSWLDTSFHFVDTYLMLQDMFIDHDHLVFALYTYHGLSTPFFVGYLIQFSLDAHIFIMER